MIQSLNFWYLVSIAAVTLSGCSTSSYDANVSGQVKLDGQAIGPGVVTFAPLDGESNPAVGAIDDDGRYQLLTKHERGLNSGEYNVAVQVYEPEEPVAPGQRSTQTPKPLVPKKYLSTETSGLTKEVSAGTQTIDLILVTE